MKKKINQIIDTFNMSGCIDDMISILENLKEEHSNVENVWIDVDGRDGQVWGDVEETDKEYEKRLKVEARVKVMIAQQKASQKKQELKELARLKKKYEK